MQSQQLKKYCGYNNEMVSNKISLQSIGKKIGMGESMSRTLI